MAENSGFHPSSHALSFLGPSSGGGGGGGFSLANFLGGNDGSNTIDLLGLGANAFFGNKALGIEEDKLDVLQNNARNAASAQNFSLANQLALQRATTTVGTPEHQQVLDAQANGTYQAVS